MNLQSKILDGEKSVMDSGVFVYNKELFYTWHGICVCLRNVFDPCMMNEQGTTPTRYCMVPRQIIYLAVISMH